MSISRIASWHHAIKHICTSKLTPPDQIAWCAHTHQITYGLSVGMLGVKKEECETCHFLVPQPMTPMARAGKIEGSWSHNDFFHATFIRMPLAQYQITHADYLIFHVLLMNVLPSA